jgi:hypothetical protein
MLAYQLTDLHEVRVNRVLLQISLSSITGTVRPTTTTTDDDNNNNNNDNNDNNNNNNTPF